MITTQRWEKKSDGLTLTVVYTRVIYLDCVAHSVTTSFEGSSTERIFKSKNAAMNFIRRILK